MIELPNLPHDNLYKFIAFAGLAILISLNYLYFTTKSELDSELSVLEAKTVNLETGVLKDSNDNNNDNNQVSNGSKAKRTDELDNIRIEQAAFHARFRGFTELSELYPFGNALGLTMLLAGISFWYRIIQRPQDIILTFEAKKSGISGIEAERNRRPRRLKP